MRSICFGRGLLSTALAAAVLGAPARAADVSQYLPDGTLLVVSFNIKQLMDSALVKTDEKAFKDGMSELTKALEGFGVDPNKDLSRVVLAAGMDFQKTLVLLEGKFDADKVHAKLKEMAKDEKHNLTVADDDKLVHYKLKLPKAPFPKPAFRANWSSRRSMGIFSRSPWKRERSMTLSPRRAGRKVKSRRKS